MSNQVLAAYQSVTETAEKIRNDEPRTIEFMEVGDIVRQGDIYIVKVDKPIAGKPWTNGRQLAFGTTQGSRHIVEGSAILSEPDEAKATAVLNRLIPATKGVRQFFGPSIKADTAFEVTHPEHANYTLPAGNYLVTSQRAFAEEIRRTMD